MKGVLVAVVALLALAVVILVLGVIGPFVAVAGLIVAGLVLLDPGGAGRRLRGSPGWWAIPGMRAAATGAVPFASLVIGYAVALPMLAFTLTHAVSLTSPTQPAAVTALSGGVSAGEATGLPTPAPTPAPTVSPQATPAPTAAPTPTPVAVPSPTRPAPIIAAPLVVTTPAGVPATTARCGAPDNPWGYTLCAGAGGPVRKPAAAFCSYFPCAGSFWTSSKGFVVECGDGLYVHDGGRPDACSGDGGAARTLYGQGHGGD